MEAVSAGRDPPLRTQARQARIVEIPEATHLCFIRPQDESLVVREMKSFLAKH